MARLRGELGPLERSVMELMWDGTREATVRDILDSPTAKDLAYTTVMTILDRLWRKEFLSRRRRGRAYVYRARLTRDEYIAGLLGTVLAGSKDRRTALLGFVRSVDPGDLDELRKLIRTVERERKPPEP